MNGWRIIDGQEWLTWGDGLTGSDGAMRDVALMEHQGRVSVVPGVTVKADAKNEVSAYAMALLALPGGSLSGEPPDLMIPPLPEGAVG